MYKTLIEADSLFQLVATDNTVIVDCRFNLADPSAGYAQYAKAHIPGALYAHLDTDLSAPIIPGISGRHPLPLPEDFIETLRSRGVNTDSQIVAYDDAAGAIAARLWWLCRWVGFDNCAVLNGGISAWTARGYTLTEAIEVPAAGTVSMAEALVNSIEVTDLPDSQRLLVDARDPERYEGSFEPLDPVSGHIPGAVNLPFAGNLDSDKKFLDSKRLRLRFEALETLAGQDTGGSADKGNASNRTITHYCGSGVTAAHNVLAMVHAGFPATDLYAGSWSEWIQDKNRSVETVGETPTNHSS